MSEDSLAISTAILAVPYAAFQAASLPGTTPSSLDRCWMSENAELMERAMAVDEATSALGFRLDVRLCTSSAGDVGVETAGCFDLRRKGMGKTDGQVRPIVG